MTDHQLLISTIREAGRIIAEYLEPGALGAEDLHLIWRKLARQKVQQLFRSPV
jgi:hypothetical protein